MNKKPLQLKRMHCPLYTSAKPQDEISNTIKPCCYYSVAHSDSTLHYNNEN